MNEDRNGRIAITIILILFVGVSLAYSVVNPLHEATDELRHYRFVRYVATEHALPVQGALSCRTQAHHPPLYYAAAALLTGWIDTGRPVCYEPPQNPFWAYRYWDVGTDNKNQYLHGADEAWPWHGEALAAHLARALNVLIGAGVVWLTWAIARAIWQERPYLAVGAAAFVAFNPMFNFMAGAINNDIIAALGGAAVTLGCVRLLRDERGLSWRWGIILGALFGMALLSKFNLAAIALTIEVDVTWVAWRKKQWRQWWQANIAIAVTTLLVAGWWFVRNQILYGEPTGVERLTELWGVRDPADSWGVAIFELPYVWTSLWGRFGYGQVPLPQAIYDGLWWFALFATAGLALPLLRRRPDLREAGFPLALLALNVALFFGVIFNYLLISPAGPMGRFFFPALPSLAILLFFGLSQWGELIVNGEWLIVNDERPLATRHLPLAVLVNGGMLALTLVALFGYLGPAYARPSSFTDAELPNVVDAQFDSFVTLRGYDVAETAVTPGGYIDLNLYWEVKATPPGNYLLFVHLEDGVGMVAQRDTHPGLGNFPSSLWQPGDRFVESIRLYLPETAYALEMATLSVGLYAPVEGYRLGITAVGGTGLGDALTLTQIAIQSNAGEYPNPQNYNFNDQVRLVGYAYDKRVLAAGEPLTLRLYWQALVDNPMGYEVEVGLRRSPGEDWDAVSSMRQELPTAEWRAGEVMVTEYVLETAVPPDNYLIHVALIDTSTQTAQNILAEDGHWIDDHLLLAIIRIEP
ncbi:MAG: phospholipid carrier-dependent glycosyltransferase [Anaerolineales bacterium]|nr:phospholipid carrier-dependent glycosyltransferase [Anaerolineales bacterium]MCB9004683.1 phospholipid carrier-dependent glycosyltransferase [Ardenticatenaceae bacterium]